MADTLTEPVPLVPPPVVSDQPPAPGHIDLGVLWEMIDRHRLSREQETLTGKHVDTTWELVILQAVLIVLLVMVTIIWALCCRRKCRGSGDELSVAEALRKVSKAKLKDLPPRYSQADLVSMGISVNDYLNPPPKYLDLFTDNLQYLDLEQGHNRLAKLSFCNDDGGARLARLSVASCENCSHESPVVVPIRPDRVSSSSTASSSSSSSSSRRQSRNSKVSFSEEVECSNGSIRRLSTNSLIGLKTDTCSTSSRRSSSSSEGSRKSSLKTRIERKFGSSSNDSFISNLDEELQRKLESIGEDVKKEDVTKAPLGQKEEIVKIPVTAESQAERAAKVCDILPDKRDI